MHHPCVASTISVGGRGGFSFSFNDNPRWSSECYPSFCCSSSSYFSCCYCYGLRQSSLIQWASYRKLVLGGFDPQPRAQVSVYDVGRNCCCDRTCWLSEKSGIGSVRKERLRTLMVFEERTERMVDEAEIVLSLLADSVDGGEYLDVTREGRRVARMNIEEQEENRKGRIKTKRAEAGVSERESTFVRKQEENARRVRSSTLLASGRAGEKEERRVLLREMDQRNDENGEEEEIKFVKEKRRNSRKDGSSCSSYYSFSSESEHQSDEEVQHRQEEYSEGSAISHERNSRSNEVVFEGTQEENKIHEDRREDVSKKSSGKEFYVGSSSVESDFRKKSEKKLTDASVGEMELRQKTSEKESKHFIEQESNYGKSSDYNVTYDDRKDKSTRKLSFIEEKKQERNRASDSAAVDSERMLKYKQLTNVQGIENIDIRSSNIFQKSTYDEKSDISAKVASSSHKEVEEGQNVVGITTRDELNCSSIQVSELSGIQKIDTRKASISHQSFETTTSKEDSYSAFLSSKKDNMKQQIEFEQVSGQMASERKSSSQSEIRNKSLLEQSDQIAKQKKKVNLAYGSSTVESEELQTQAYAEHIESAAQFVSGSDEKTKMSTAQFCKEDAEYGAGDGPSDVQTSILILQQDGTESSRQVEKSSTSYVNQYIDKVRHEASSSERKKETKTGVIEILHEKEQSQQSVVQHASGDSQSEKHYSRGEDSSSGARGPSIEMWKLKEPSNSSQSEALVQDDEIKTDSELAKRSGRNLWNIIGDFFRFKWGNQQSEGHHSGRTVKRSPQTQSVASEAWFSSHEAEETEEASVKKGGSSGQVSQDKTKLQVEEGSSSSTSDGHLKIEGLQVTTESPAIVGSSSFGGETSGGSVGVGVTSPILIINSSAPSPASRLQRSPVFQGAVEAGEANDPDNGTRRLSPGSESTASEGKLKRGMLQRADQIQRDRFDEWEEAYRLETEQRKIDEMFMREALLEAQKAADHWEVPVGAVLVHNGKIIARGFNLVEEQRDSTAHAEMICIRQASNLLRTWRLLETILYVTLEPCPMCAGAILQARIETVVWGAPNKLLGADGSWIRIFPNGGNGLEHSDKPPAPVHPFHPKITIRRGILASECADSMQQFFRLRRKKKDVKDERRSPQTSCLPAPHRHSNIFSKMHHAFSLMFSL